MLLRFSNFRPVYQCRGVQCPLHPLRATLNKAPTFAVAPAAKLGTPSDSSGRTTTTRSTSSTAAGHTGSSRANRRFCSDVAFIFLFFRDAKMKRGSAFCAPSLRNDIRATLECSGWSRDLIKLEWRLASTFTPFLLRFRYYASLQS